MNNAEHDFGQDIDDVGGKPFSPSFPFSFSISMPLISGFLPIIHVFRLRRMLDDVSVSANLLRFLIRVCIRQRSSVLICC